MHTNRAHITPRAVTEQRGWKFLRSKRKRVLPISCTKLVYAMWVLKTKGLPRQSLQDVFRATVEAKLLLNSFLRRCLKLGYRDSDSPDLDSRFSDSDEQLFDRINHNGQHNITAIFNRPPWFEVELQFPQPTPQQDIIWKTSELNDRDFIIRNLCKYCY